MLQSPLGMSSERVIQADHLKWKRHVQALMEDPLKKSAVSFPARSANLVKGLFSFAENWTLYVNVPFAKYQVIMILT